MKYVVIDLEMNPIARSHKEVRKLCTNEIIQIGAVMLDEHYMEIDHFSTLVKPELNTTINKNIEALTGISIDRTYDKPVFAEAIHQFFTWCAGAEDDICFCEWSNSDYEQVMKEMKSKDYCREEYSAFILVPWTDLQKEYADKIGLEKSPSLESALSYAGIDFEGKSHDALNDARNTGIILNIIRDDALLQKQLEKTMEALRPSKIESTLGAMFDFSKFGLS